MLVVGYPDYLKVENIAVTHFDAKIPWIVTPGKFYAHRVLHYAAHIVA